MLTGCAGLAISVPGPSAIEEIDGHYSDFDDPDYLPREKEVYEVVTRDKTSRTIKFQTTEDSRPQGKCHYVFLVLKISVGDCKRVETWYFKEGMPVTVETHTHRIMGLWCSIIPYFLFLSPGLLDARLGDDGYDFFFCTFEPWSRMYMSGNPF